MLIIIKTKKTKKPSSNVNVWDCQSRYYQQQWPIWFFGRNKQFDSQQASPEAENILEKLFSHYSVNGPITGTAATFAADLSPAASLAKLIVLDQFPRCAFRGTPRAFRYDAAACKLALWMTQQPWFSTKFVTIDKFFVSVALQHSEDLFLQKRGWTLAKSLTEPAPDKKKQIAFEGDGAAAVADYLKNLKGFPDEHYECIEQFGRFPHRNGLLRRAPTQEELEWLFSKDCPGWAKSQNSINSAEFYYFKGRGMGEVVRFMLAYTQQAHEEIHVTSRDQFLELRDSLKQLPFGQIPLLRVRDPANDGAVMNLSQTQAIVEYLAHKHSYLGLVGSGTAASRAFM